MTVTRLHLHHFRSYTSTALEVDSPFVVLTGANGAGKTNVLEALSLLAPGRGLRRAALTDFQKMGAPSDQGWAVAVHLKTPYGPLEIGTGRSLSPETKAERRTVIINGMPDCPQSDLTDHMAVVWLTPAMDRLFQEGAGERRRFLDRLVLSFDPAHAGRLNRYEKTLRERARILETMPQPDPMWLDALEEELARTGVAIAAARLALVERLNAAPLEADSTFPQGSITVAGLVEEQLRTLPALAVEEDMRQKLRTTRSATEPAPGPHRSDLQVRHVAKDMPAELCSTGEQKALLISLVLTHARLVRAERAVPLLLLLDEVAAHLDETRRVALFDILRTLQAQVWMTATDRLMFEPLHPHAQFVTVQEGELVRDNED